MAATGLRGKGLLLVGTVHRDPDGAGKLRRLLEKVRPAAVTVELSPYGLWYRQRYGRRQARIVQARVKKLAEALGKCWRAWGQIQAMLVQIEVPFEYEAAEKYGHDYGAIIQCVDSSEWSRRLISSQWPQLFSSRNIEALLSEEPEDMPSKVRQEYHLAGKLLNGQGGPLSYFYSRGCQADSTWQEREARMAAAVELVFRQLNSGCLLHVGGWEHLLHPTAADTLYERLLHLEPRRVLLSTGEELPA
ncbi:MAG: hypothetical protein JRJ12_14705 [Deltaproteobacteria bacterium]|nr:hypothetical protein [Deltaproteobacteria bacterium]